MIEITRRLSQKDGATSNLTIHFFDKYMHFRMQVHNFSIAVDSLFLDYMLANTVNLIQQFHQFLVTFGKLLFRNFGLGLQPREIQLLLGMVMLMNKRGKSESKSLHSHTRTINMSKDWPCHFPNDGASDHLQLIVPLTKVEGFPRLRFLCL